MATLLLAVPSATYIPQQITVQPTLPAGKTEVKVTMTTVGWPTGHCANVTINYPDGTMAGGAAISGGTPNKQGVFEASVGLGLSTGLPSGNYGVVIDVAQTVVSAVKVESIP